MTLRPPPGGKAAREEKRSHGPPVNSVGVTADRVPEDLTRLVWTLHRRLLQGQKPPAEEKVRPLAQVELLHLVAAEPGITVQQAAAALRMKPHNVSTLVTLLVRDGYFARVPDPADRRYVQLHPTPKMLDAAEQSNASSYRSLAQALSDLPEGAEQRIAAALPDLWNLIDQLNERP
ncbi:MarR family winged helix-turn-helix transcriptional regulator [Streptomyces sp. NBC_00441]|uniref:MarR family winged helix-turn-helix transcriptional regulator n=1 Tax=Streptomyces sp. NBC_00441 TaxID=2975742 RepID=UPI002E2E3DFB|nr:MarR family winged helix-turn-helix transcriptional regulator [Streptomyces sp. NBC_00441]